MSGTVLSETYHLAALKLVNEGSAPEVLLSDPSLRSELRTTLAPKKPTLSFAVDNSSVAILKAILSGRIREKLKDDSELFSIIEKANNYIHQVEFSKVEALTTELRILRDKPEKKKFLPKTLHKKLEGLANLPRLNDPVLRQDARLILIEAFVNRLIHYEPGAEDIPDRPATISDAPAVTRTVVSVSPPADSVPSSATRPSSKQVFSNLLDNLNVEKGEKITAKQLAEKAREFYQQSGFGVPSLASLLVMIYADKSLRNDPRLQKKNPALAVSTQVPPLLASQAFIELMMHIFKEHEATGNPLTVKRLVRMAIDRFQKDRPVIQTEVPAVEEVKPVQAVLPAKQAKIRRPSEIENALEAKAGLLKDKTLFEVWELLGKKFHLASVSRYLKKYPELYDRFGIIKPKRIKEALEAVDPNVLKGLNVSQAAKVLGVKERALANYLYSHSGVREKFGIELGHNHKSSPIYSAVIRVLDQVSVDRPVTKEELAERVYAMKIKNKLGNLVKLSVIKSFLDEMPELVNHPKIEPKTIHPSVETQIPSKVVPLTDVMLQILHERSGGDIPTAGELVPLVRARNGSAGLSPEDQELLDAIERVASSRKGKPVTTPVLEAESKRKAVLIRRPKAILQKTLDWVRAEGIEVNGKSFEVLESAVIEKFRKQLVDAPASLRNRRLNHATAMIDQDDLINEGLIALVNAIYTFDPQRGVKFSSYVQTRINGAFLDFQRQTDHLTRSMRIQQQNGGQIPHLVSIHSVNEDDHGDQSGELGDVIADPNAEINTNFLSDKDVARQFFDRLREDEKLILILYYYEGLTFKEIGDMLSVSESRISQKHTEMIRRLAGRDLTVFTTERVPGRKKLALEILESVPEGEQITTRELASAMRARILQEEGREVKTLSLVQYIYSMDDVTNHPKIRKLPKGRPKLPISEAVSEVAPAPQPIPTVTKRAPALKHKTPAQKSNAWRYFKKKASRSIDQLNLPYPLINLLNAHGIRTEAALKRFFESGKQISGLGRKSRDAIAKVLETDSVRSELRFQMPNPTASTVLAIRNRIGLRSSGFEPFQNDVTQIVGLLPDLAKLPDLVEAVANHIGGENRIVVFASGPVAARKIKNYLTHTEKLEILLKKGEIIVTHQWNADEILSGNMTKAQLFLNGLPSDARIATQAEKLLKSRMEIIQNIAPLELLETDLGIAGFAETLRSELRKQFLEAIAA